MAAFVKVSRAVVVFSLKHKRLPCLPLIRHAGNWNYEWQPGSYPVTEEEKAAAAKKYGLRREDYEPYPDDGFGHGDYPKLPPISAASRDPYENWDMREHRRNYMEPFHVDADWMREEMWDPSVDIGAYSYRQMLLFTFGLMTFMFGGHFLSIAKFPWFMPVLPKQYPSALKGSDKKHYTFPSHADGAHAHH